MTVPAADPAVLAAEVPVLEARGLCLDYVTDRAVLRAVDDVSFTIGEGERLVLLGASGCGKSSILKAVAGFLAPAAGRIALRGATVTGPGPDRIVVFQEFDQLLPWMTVADNVAFPLRVARKLSRGEARARALDALRKVGLERAVEQFPHMLSGGMKQRAAIARALATGPDILLMDEPFAALDALTRLQMQRDLIAIAEDLGVTLLFVTHAIDEAVLIGTRLHLLSPHPGRTLGSFETAGLGVGDLGSARFEAVTREVHDLLFARP
ncbi:ABC transporter ATP-binding protein [Zavarzinia compransoris]|uniref:ABC transporter n=1 Tax=Zavarzinia compransoris TaxID=1264899 RepID=A0A317DYF1_9PROT|nr:ABC transporter ATP-binding protein [Zavarzinia compransoris]PWR19768.1 ABC transporter [Zavarzinia compransoris]TDP45130.1 NitT/TauT family transport system ATP-binding protein [Zavarzinia compransoris]